MRCSNCGKDVPYLGKVCPFCHVDKSHDKRVFVRACFGFVAGALVGLFAGRIIGSDTALVLAPFFVGFIGSIIGAACTPSAPEAGKHTGQPGSVFDLFDANTGDTKECAFCAETIKRAARVCRYCSRDQPAASTDA